MARPKTAQRTLQGVEAVRSVIRHGRRLARVLNAIEATGALTPEGKAALLDQARLTADAITELLLPDEET